ncbi:MAG: hydrolase [Candidatus Binatia bacterium]|nr:MAG: hydrolase [Candidatus Binatia bacterium]
MDTKEIWYAGDIPGVRHRKLTADGLDFHLAELGSGPNLALCLHGFPECWYSWRYQMPLLAQLGFRVWAPDLRGYGGSARPARVGDYAIEHLMSDVARFIDASRAETCVLIGHDWGALIAWYFAMRRLRPLDALVILNVPHPAIVERVMWGRQLLRSWYVFFFQLPWLPELVLAAFDYRAIKDAFLRMARKPSCFPPEVIQVYRDYAAQPGALTAMVNYYRALARGGARRQRQLGYPPIDVPTLMIWGEEDDALGKETTYGTDRFVRSLELHYLPGVSHWVQQEAPDQVNAILADWLPKRISIRKS